MLPPRTFPPPTTVQHYFSIWWGAGLWPSINHGLVMMARLKAGRAASPTACVIDSQSVKTMESGGIWGFDAGKKLVGRKRHIVTDTQAFMVGATMHAADGQDRDSAASVIAVIHNCYPWLRNVFADGGYAGKKLKAALARMGKWTIQIVKRSDKAKGFEVIPRRWVVERTFAWLSRKPQARQGLRADSRKRNRLALHRLHPASRQTNRKSLTSIAIFVGQTLRNSEGRRAGLRIQVIGVKV